MFYTSPTEVNVYRGQYSSNDQDLRTQNVYDGFGRQLESRTYTAAATYESTPQVYDALGRVASIINELGYATRYMYDPLGRTLSAQTLDGAVTTMSYAGNVVTAMDQAGKQRQTTTDGLGRLTQVLEDPTGLNYSTAYKYDALGDLTAVAQGSQARTFTYDSLKRLLTSLNPESGTITYTYDGDGNLATRIDNSKITTSFSYDSLNRLLTKTYSNGTPTVTYTYCNPTTCSLSYGRGHLQSIATSAGNSTTYSAYSAAGQVLGQTQTIGASQYPLSYSYIPAGELAQEVYPSGRQLSFGYNYGNLPQYLGGVLGSTSTTYVGWTGFAGFKETYRSLGSLGALVLNRGYNIREQTSSLTLHNWNHSDNSPDYVQFNMVYSYGGSTNNGNLLSVSEQNSPTKVASPMPSLSAAINTSYGYDNVNRMTNVTDSSYSRTMCYDGFGNGWVTNYTGTTPLPGNAPSEIGATCPASKATSPYLASSNQINGVSYDLNGNETSFRGNTLVYDAENRVTSVKNGATVVVSYQYDGNGQRISKTNSSGTTNYVYDALGRVASEYVNGAISKDYVRLSSAFIPPNNQLVAIENAAGNGSPCGTCFVISDDLGSVRLMADSSGNAIARHDFLPFGEEALADVNRPAAVGFDGGDGAVQRFTGKERDSESGLDYFGARYYGSALGRFSSPDPSPAGISMQDPQSWNLYSYVRNRPLAMVDINGNWATPIHGDVVTYALQGYVSAGELAVLRDRQWVMDSDQKPQHEYLHFMNQGSSVAWQFVADMLSTASANTDASGSISTMGLYALGDALHTVQDYTSPEHTDENFEPKQYRGGFMPWQWGATLDHASGESSPGANWSRIGLAIRLTMAAFLQVDPIGAAKHGLTDKTFDAEASKRIEQYLQNEFTKHEIGMSPRQQDAARLCALGNPAACP